MEEQKGGYFESALSDFVFDVAAGGAIRHLVDRGYSVEQIMKKLDYPVPRPKVEKAVYRHLTESGILLSELPEEDEKMYIRHMQADNKTDKNRFAAELVNYIGAYGEENAYMECPFGLWIGKDDKKLREIMEPLSVREREYVIGIQWGYDIMYHRLNDRMREIGVKLAVNTDEKWNYFFFIKKTV